MDIDYTDGHTPDEERLIEAMNASHAFPGPYPVVIIMRNTGDERARLDAAVAYIQDGDLFTITERQSSRGGYLSFHLALWVEDARSALQRKEDLRALAGVVSIL